MKPHKWAKEIKAWADGAEIEYYDSGVNDWRDKTFPDWFENYQYRIKPQPKELQYLYVYQGVTDMWLSPQKHDVSNYVGKIKLENEDAI